MTKKSKKNRFHIEYLIFALMAVIFLAAVAVVIFSSKSEKNKQEESSVAITTTITTTTATTTTTSRYPQPAERTTETVQLSPSDEMTAKNVILLDTDKQIMLAEFGADTEIAPASMTKIMTLIVAIETLTPEQKNGAAIIDAEQLKPLIAMGASRVGYVAGEAVSVHDLLYGTILPSGADAAVTLACYTAGSIEGFVQLMNEKSTEIGLSHTHFCNPTGLDEEGHYSTVHDIARLLQYAISIPECKEILSTPQHITAATAEHPTGIELKSIVFSRLGDNVLQNITFGGGKTGFTKNAGNCLASWATDICGNTYICVVAGCEEQLYPIYDTLTLYDRYTYLGTKTYARPVVTTTTDADEEIES